jgi:hypothetical protein
LIAEKLKARGTIGKKLIPKIKDYSELRSWGAHPPRVLLDAPRVQPLEWVTDTEVSEISTRPMFSARARKTAPVAGALPINFGIQDYSFVKTSW